MVKDNVYNDNNSRLSHCLISLKHVDCRVEYKTMADNVYYIHMYILFNKQHILYIIFFTLQMFNDATIYVWCDMRSDVCLFVIHMLERQYLHKI